ncbi:MAG TPA: TIGR03032 family protein [Acetobacteraceae bacterium]|jgi:uncharacterized protein (TIGR03032 family)|nr:TIGR03032 family protein [Acetobacteraceae bacterium]
MNAPALRAEADSGFVEFLDRTGASLVIGALPGSIMCVGVQRDATMLSATPIARPIAVAATPDRLAVATRRGVTVYALSRRLAPHYPAQTNAFDGIFVPVGALRLGPCLIHDMLFDGPGLVFANTRFSCLARSDGPVSFVPMWQPRFISALQPDDRCHLNSLAVEPTGRIRYVTAYSQSDIAEGYRANPPDAGVVIDVETHAIVASGLLRPHSARVFDDQVYVLNSGAGQLLRVDPTTRSVAVLAELQGFTRGLRRLGDVLLVGFSALRAGAQRDQLPIFADAGRSEPGIAAVDRLTGRIVGVLRFTGVIEEVVDFDVVPDARRLYVQDEAADRYIGIETPEVSFWMNAERER